MNRYSHPVLIAILFITIYEPPAPAANDEILSGRDLLTAIRKSEGRNPKLAYSNRTVKSQPILTKDQDKTELKSSVDKLSVKDGTIDVNRFVSALDIKDKATDIPVQKPSRKTAALSTLSPEMPFEEAIEILRNSVKPTVNIVVLWRDLEENADIYRSTPINIEGISDIQFSTALKLLLRSVSVDDKLDYAVEDGVIIIATKQSLPKKLHVRSFDVSSLLSKPADYRGNLGSSNRRNTSTNY